MRRGVVVLVATILVLGLAACTSSSREPLGEFTAGGQGFEFIADPNTQGPDAPCVGVSYENVNGGYTHLACPTLASEETEYVAALDVSEWTFVVGYGLQPGEELVLGDALFSMIAEWDGRRFFVIQHAHDPDTHSYEVLVTKPDGTTRSIGFAGD